MSCSLGRKEINVIEDQWMRSNIYFNGRAPLLGESNSFFEWKMITFAICCWVEPSFRRKSSTNIQKEKENQNKITNKITNIQIFQQSSTNIQKEINTLFFLSGKGLQHNLWFVVLCWPEPNFRRKQIKRCFAVLFTGGLVLHQCNIHVLWYLCFAGELLILVMHTARNNQMLQLS